MGYSRWDHTELDMTEATHSDRWEVVLNCNFLMISDVEHLFMYSSVFFGKISNQIFCPFFNSIVCTAQSACLGIRGKPFNYEWG